MCRNHFSSLSFLMSIKANTSKIFLIKNYWPTLSTNTIKSYLNYKTIMLVIPLNYIQLLIP